MKKMPESKFTTDEEIVAGIKQKNTAALSALYEKYSGPVGGLIQRIITEETEAGKVLEHSFVLYWDNIYSFNSEYLTLLTWLMSFARSTSYKVMGTAGAEPLQLKRLNDIIGKLTTDYQFENVLIIEDNELESAMEEIMMKKSRFAKNIVTKSSVQSALSYLEKDIEKFPEMILLDLRMPIMDGFDFLEAYQDNIAKLAPECKIVILSGNTSEEDKKKVIRNPVVKRFIPKPLTQSKLAGLSQA
jgi:CheY-like chemotaxis protein